MRSRPLPRDLDYEAAIEEYVGGACLLIVEHLTDFRGEGPLVSYIKALIQTAMSDKDLKNLLQATKRFLKIVNTLSAVRQQELYALFSQHPKTETDMLLAYVNGKKPDLLDSQHQRLWYRARMELLRDRCFIDILQALASEGCSQAETILVWHNAYQDPISLPSYKSIETNPLMDLVEREQTQHLLQCLEELRQKSKKHYQAVFQRFYHDMPYSNIATTLGAHSSATVRKWVQRGLERLRECLERKQTD